MATKKELIYNSNIINIISIKNSIKKYINFHPYINLLINIGYDPFSENYISISPLFCQKNKNNIELILKNIDNNNYGIDLYYETILHKPLISNYSYIIDIFYKYINKLEFTNLNYQNILLNTPLHITNDIEIINKLLSYKINPNLKNINNLTPYQYHIKKKNYKQALTIYKYNCSKKIQKNWKRFYFKKTFVPIKNYIKKKNFLDDFILLPESICGKFPGGIQYQINKNNFNNLKYL